MGVETDRAARGRRKVPQAVGQAGRQTAVEAGLKGPSTAGEGPSQFAQDAPTLTVEPGRALPVFAIREGVPVAVITAAEYRELCALRAQQARGDIGAAVRALRAPPPGLSTVEKDSEVADFLRDLFRGRMSLQALHAACVERFGAERAPSVGRIQTFRSRWRAY